MPSLLDTLVGHGVKQLWIVYHDYGGLSHGKTVPPERFLDVGGLRVTRSQQWEKQYD
jgi:hypothetical protein